MEASFRQELMRRRAEVRAVVERNAASRPRLFGSVARGEDGPGSDIDILVETQPGCSLLDLGGIEVELSDLFGRVVDVRTLHDIHPRLRPTILHEAVAL